MSLFCDAFARTPRQKERLQKVGQLADSFAMAALEDDQAHRFSFTHVEALRSIGYPALTVLQKYGGQEISLYEFVLVQERLAQGDPGIALGMGWHLSILFELAVTREWRESVFSRLSREIVEKGVILNRAVTEVATGSPSRGGKPTTRAARAEAGYVLSGHKIFTTFAPVLDYFLVTATLEDTGETAEFLLPRGTPGLIIDESRKMMGMRGTASYDLFLRQAQVPEQYLLRRYSAKSQATPSPWLLHIPACYLGIALAARREALAFALSYQPNTLAAPIMHTPQVQRLIGEIDLELIAARHLLYAVAQRWDEGTEEPARFASELAVAKQLAVAAAMKVVDKALRITGVHGLESAHPLQKMYRDVRFGLHNPPMEDTTIQLLANQAIKESEHG